MEESDSELRAFFTPKIPANNPRLCSPHVTVNQILLDHLHRDGFTPNRCTGPYLFNPTIPCRAGQVSQGFGLPSHAACSQDGRGSEAGMKRHLGDERWESCYWNHVANRDAAGGEDKYSSQTESDEEDLEPPLPLRSDEELQDYSPVFPPNHYMHRCDLHHAVEGQQHNFDPVGRHPPQSYHHFAPCQHRKAWFDPQSWLCSHDMVANDGLALGGVSVNVPQFFVPPVESMSQVSVSSQNPADAGGSVSDWREKRQTVNLPTVSRNVFVTYSSDISSEILPFVDFLTKHGFRPAIDIFDDPVRCMDINKWKDRHLKDPSTLIVIAISPKYKEDIEGSGVDSHSLHTRYIYAMMQNEFIQQGSLNFRFIPVLFLNASQKHVPTWLQNTRVYRWPLDTEDLLLRLLREEKYIPPPVPVELTLLIKPVFPSSAVGP